VIYKLKGRKYYRVKFHFKGETIHKCTRATDAKTARSIEATLRSELAKGNWGILQRKPTPALKEFLTKDFLPFTRARFAGKGKTCEYYEYGADRLNIPTWRTSASTKSQESTPRSSRLDTPLWQPLRSTADCGPCLVP
jgi:hypothetical protein